jgi:cytochrome c oxidase assembly protein subunit 17
MSFCPLSKGKTAAANPTIENSQPTTASADDKPLKPCCACPDTRKARDECILMKGEEHCQDYINSHKECLKSYGFIV